MENLVQVHNPVTFDNFCELAKKMPLKGSFPVKFTKEIADGLLEHNKINRPLSDAQTRKYAELIKQKHWEERNGENIKIQIIDGDIYLYDGQHRLSALSTMPNANVIFDVFTTDSEGVMASVDVGKPRSLKDVVNMTYKPKGLDQNTANILSDLSSCAYHAYKAYEDGTRKFVKTKQATVTYLRFAEENPELLDAVNFMKREELQSFLMTEMNNPAIGTAHCILTRKYGKEYAESFLSTYITLCYEEKVLAQDHLLNQARVKWINHYKHRVTFTKKKDGETRANGKVVQERTLGFILTVSNALLKKTKRSVGEKFYEGDIRNVAPLPELLDADVSDFKSILFFN